MSIPEGPLLEVFERELIVGEMLRCYERDWRQKAEIPTVGCRITDWAKRKRKKAAPNRQVSTTKLLYGRDVGCNY